MTKFRNPEEWNMRNSFVCPAEIPEETPNRSIPPPSEFVELNRNHQAMVIPRLLCMESRLIENKDVGSLSALYDAFTKVPDALPLRC